MDKSKLFSEYRNQYIDYEATPHRDWSIPLMLAFGVALFSAISMGLKK